MPTSTPTTTPAGELSLPDLESELLGLAGHIAAAECRFLRLLAEFDDRGGWCGVGIRSCAHWLTWRAGMSLRTATEHLRVAHALTRLPRITEAFAAGRISYSTVRAVTRLVGAHDAVLDRMAAAASPGTATEPLRRSGSDPDGASGGASVDAGTGTARLAGGPEIDASTAERLACDARARVLLTDRAANRMYLGRSRRLASPAQIAALTADGGGSCRFPGCHHTRHLHAHHVRHWLRGGSTDIDNLVLLCPFHHRLVHDHGYLVLRPPGEDWLFHRPDGTPVEAMGRLPDGSAESLVERNTRARLRIDRSTLTPDRYGDRLDPEPILDALLPPGTTAAAA